MSVGDWIGFIVCSLAIASVIVGVIIGIITEYK